MIIESLKRYWELSQQYESTLSKQAKDVFIECRLRPILARESDPKQKELLSRLIARRTAA